MCIEKCTSGRSAKPIKRDLKLACGSVYPRPASSSQDGEETIAQALSKIGLTEEVLVNFLRKGGWTVSERLSDEDVDPLSKKEPLPS